jgi:outer membrane receptor protein involved in Fe transport
MKKLLLALLIAIPVFATGQNQSSKFSVTGIATDSLTHETLPYVTCSLAPEKNPAQIFSRFAGDLDGNFSAEIKNAGTYVLVVSCVGQDPYTTTFTVSEQSKKVNLGKIKLAPARKALKDLEVVAVKPLIKAEADKITYDAEQDPESKSSTVLDMLRKVPMVTVDGQDNIQLKGASNFKFFLNGKPTNMFNNNPGMILKSIPANMVKTVEVITQPGAKYDAEGVGGIINIVTVQQSSAKGYSATINGQGSSRGSYGGGLNLILQSGKFSFSGNYNYSVQNGFPVKTTTVRETYVPTLYPYGTQVATSTNKTPMQFGSGQLTYEADSMNLLTFSFNRHFGRPEITNDAKTENYDNVDPLVRNQVFGYTQKSTQNQTWGGTDFGVDYQHSFRKKAEMLTVSYRLSNSPNSSNYDATNTLDANYVSQPQRGLAQHIKSNNIANTNEHTFQADYTNPVGKGQTLEMGAKYIRRLNSSQTDETFYYFDFDQTYPFPTYKGDSVSSFSNNQDIAGAYGTYTANIGKWSLKGGLRYEYTWLKANFDDNARDFGTEYDSWVPSAIATCRLTDMRNMKLGYNMRIQRPGIGYLNPYVNRSDPNYINYGNPNLDPENNHNITLGYSDFSAKYNLNAELSYSFVNNAIEQYSFINPGSSVQEITYDNIGKRNQLGMNLFGSYRGVKWLNLYANGSVNYVDLRSNNSDMANSGFTGRVFMGGTITLPKDFRISTGAGGNLAQINLQGSQSGFMFSYMALSKDFFKKRLNVSLSGVYLPFPKIVLTTNGVDSNTGNPTFYQRTDVDITKNAELRMNISYRLGSMNMQVKKTSKTISNDDQKEKQNTSFGESPM